MSLKNSIENLKFDSRMVDINLKNHSLSQADINKHLEKLPDLKERCEAIDFENSSADHDSFGGSEN